ncbi:DUF723 domain-containing protein [Acinetobacter schindleri]|uniref:DUF723 domain-containing protein n=1 Tax=Acinetobacter sp. HA TaxID=1173062 RepID=UPI000263E692|nr:DUF723 domain-containing protein [Acinetobacter sp. HA]EIM39491.1 hypothetical protein HADU_06579 [Acinetobacter sp. HA]
MTDCNSKVIANAMQSQNNQKPKKDNRGGHNKLKQADVIQQFIAVHGERYDYSLVNYNGVDVPVKIICSKHGIFSQTPYRHKKQKSGCPLCNKPTPYTRQKYIKACENHKGISNLYVIKLTGGNEVFYKIGITVYEVKERYSGYYMPYQFEILHFISGDAGFIWDLEKKLHSLMNDFHYTPLKRFGGSKYECFLKIPKKIDNLLKSIKGSEQIPLIA